MGMLTFFFLTLLVSALTIPAPKPEPKPEAKPDPKPTPDPDLHIHLHGGEVRKSGRTGTDYSNKFRRSRDFPRPRPEDNKKWGMAYGQRKSDDYQHNDWQLINPADTSLMNILNDKIEGSDYGRKRRSEYGTDYGYLRGW